MVGKSNIENHVYYGLRNIYRLSNFLMCLISNFVEEMWSMQSKSAKALVKRKTRF